MKYFNGKKAVEDFQSCHTLTFSTPELIVMRYSLWLSETVPDKENEDSQGYMPRMMQYMEERDYIDPNKDKSYDDEDVFVPSGAIADSGPIQQTFTESSESFAGKDKSFDESGMQKETTKTTTSQSPKFCPECGSKASSVANFCPQCGSAIEE